jgi:putative salt-induced outer membrane protein YdiY
MLVTLAGAVMMATPLVAQDENPWKVSAELTAVWTAGNAASNALGAEVKVTRSTEASDIKLEAGAIRAQSTKTARTAVGTASSFTIQETSVSEKTAEAFFARGRYDYRFSSRVFAFGGADWLRNQFAGIDSRLLFAVGAGATLVEGERLTLKADVSGTYTFQEDVVANPFVKTNFPGIRAGYDLSAQVTGTTSLSSVAIADLNLDNTDDVRIDWTNAVQVAISSRLAFKPSLQLLWRNAPSLTDIDLFDAGGAAQGTVSVPLDKLDSLFKVALVVNF